MTTDQNHPLILVLTESSHLHIEQSTELSLYIQMLSHSMHLDHLVRVLDHLEGLHHPPGGVIVHLIGAEGQQQDLLLGVDTHAGPVAPLLVGVLEDHLQGLSLDHLQLAGLVEDREVGRA